MPFLGLGGLGRSGWLELSSPRGIGCLITEGHKLEPKTQQQVTKNPEPLLPTADAPPKLSWLFQESPSPDLKDSKLGKVEVTREHIRLNCGRTPG